MYRIEWFEDERGYGQSSRGSRLRQDWRDTPAEAVAFARTLRDDPWYYRSCVSVLDCEAGRTIYPN